jgi:hypothetical protein
VAGVTHLQLAASRGLARVSGGSKQGGTMRRFAVSLLAVLLFVGSASAQIVTDPNAKTYRERLQELRARFQAKANAVVAANKLPAVRLSATQIANLKAVASNDRVVWYGAGRQRDGRTFVCLVTSGRTLFGESRALAFGGTFEADGSFRRTSSDTGDGAVKDCRQHGFDPPIAKKNGLPFF